MIRFGEFLRKASLVFSDRQLSFIMFLAKHRYIPNFSNPRSLSEKIGYIKLFNRNPVRKVVADRIKVRDFVKSKTSSCSFPEIIWTGVVLGREDWDKLPKSFVIKANHGSKMTKVVDKDKDTYEDILKLSNLWLAKDYSKFGREWIYNGLEKYLIVEEKLGDGRAIPPDYKFFVFNGTVELIQVDVGRFSSHYRNLYDRNFKFIEAELHLPSNKNLVIDKPESLDAAIEFSEKIGSGFDFIRVDLYLVDGKIFFGELTNTPGNGLEKFTPTSVDFELGSKLPRFIRN